MFLTPLELRALIDQPGKWEVLRDLVWSGVESYVVPKGFITDLASIPAVFRSILQQNGKSRRSAVLHDFLYATQRLTRAQADKLFLTALAADGVIAVGRFLYFAGVRIGGWLPWNRRKKEIEP